MDELGSSAEGAGTILERFEGARERMKGLVVGLRWLCVLEGVMLSA